ncbi:hypothetical protein KU735_24500, partial [Salmonella enterica subsp. enterica serovar Give]|nr:hypothetical protein [Salmonella enterica subsp. enterica serovar Give]
LEKGINGAVAKIQQLFMASGNKPTHDSFIQSYVAIIVLFCASVNKRSNYHNDSCYLSFKLPYYHAIKLLIA